MGSRGNRVVIRAWSWGACMLLAFGAGTPGQAADEELPEDELLEFLGTLEGLDEDWMDYLDRTDVDKVIRAKDAEVEKP